MRLCQTKSYLTSSTHRKLTAVRGLCTPRTRRREVGDPLKRSSYAGFSQCTGCTRFHNILLVVSLWQPARPFSLINIFLKNACAVCALAGNTRSCWSVSARAPVHLVCVLCATTTWFTNPQARPTMFRTQIVPLLSPAGRGHGVACCQPFSGPLGRTDTAF